MNIDDPRKGLLDQPHDPRRNDSGPASADSPVSPEGNVNDARSSAPDTTVGEADSSGEVGSGS